MSKSFQQKYIQAVILLASCSAALSCHGSLLSSGISAEEKRIILQEHNKLRQLVATGGFPGQPAAENMQEIVWDDELAVRAQEWANNCEFRHDPKRTIKRFTMGQNLAVIWSTAPLEADDGDFPSRINNWFNEVQKYSFGASWSPKTGHYSQLVWGETNLIGCGYSEYKDRSKYNKLYVCNYGPGGNVVGYNPYEIGKPSCKNYGMNPSPRYKGLCMDPSLSPFSGASVNNIETYEYKTNKINTKTSYTSTQFNNQQLQQAKPHQQYEQQRQLPQLPTFPAIPALPKPPTTLPALISTLLQYQPLQSQILSQQPDPQQHQPEEGTQSISLPFHRKSIGEQSILRAILNPSFETAREILREEYQPKLDEIKQEPTQQQEQDQNQEPQQEEQDQNQVPIHEHENEHENENENEHKHDQEQEHQQQRIQMQEQHQHSEVEISSESTVQPASKNGWSFLTWRG